MAKLAGVSLSKLKRDFKRINGIAIHEYLISRRMEEARCLLGSGEFSVKEVAAKIGFKSAQHFSRTFRQHFGVAPSTRTPREGRPSDKPD